jgi:hypothetical protein
MKRAERIVEGQSNGFLHEKRKESEGG